MTHLSDEQLEDLTQGAASEPAHLAECAACRDRLAERRAVRDRLRSAMTSIHADASLAERIRRSTEVGVPLAARPPVPSEQHTGGQAASATRRRRLSPIAWASLATAAALVLAITGIVYLTSPESARAELVRIHEANMDEPHSFYSSDDPALLAQYLKSELGFEPAAPRLGQGMHMRGCCVAHFKGQAVGSYVVGTPQGSLSIIVVPQTSAQLGMDHPFQAGGKDFWADTFATNNMVAVRLGDYTYCAVGGVPQELLTQVLLALGLGERP